jgi:phospholipase/carboxylesterase
MNSQPMGNLDIHRPTHRLEINNLVIQARIPPGDRPHPVFVMLHGWTGDENSMWIFASRLPANAILLAPRGLYDSPMGGFSWYPKLDKAWPELNDFETAMAALTEILSTDYFPEGDFSQLRMVGFSQGAALAYSFALAQAKRLRALAGLSGFVPEGASRLAGEYPLEDVPVFIAHGIQDQLVPVERARQGVAILQQAGAVVSYCEHQADHKLNADCFRSLQIFFQQN